MALFAEEGVRSIRGSPVSRTWCAARATMTSEAMVLVVLVPGLRIRSSRVSRTPWCSPAPAAARPDTDR
ncbi:hypothetical protein CK936_22335 [Streptomyces albireticuli]|uniref:Uncharacterized protein n=1 Tax=Streptomyces albireticuli TaxID=1940 RepID=A0A2A2D660_9ACTN|nr:hypothetical protein CK936_22335 [Streptomyces albireticuli]